MTTEKFPSPFNTEEIRKNAAWYVAGISSFGNYSFVAGLITAMLMSLVVLIFQLDASSTVLGTVGTQLALNAVAGVHLEFKSRTIARTKTIEVDRF